MLIVRPTDQVAVQIGDATFYVAPLTRQQKSELLSFFRTKAGEEQVDQAAYAYRAVGMCLKDVEGIETLDGSKYELEFDEKGELTPACVEEVLSLPVADRVVAVCDRLSFTGLKEGDIDGVSIDLSKSKSLKKK